MNCNKVLSDTNGEFWQKKAKRKKEKKDRARTGKFHGERGELQCVRVTDCSSQRDKSLL